MAQIVRHYLISGRVQGVGYRAFARRSAEALNLRGWTRNLKDGRVEILAQGSSESLSLFAAKLKKGPVHGHVESVATEDREPADLPLPFEIRRDGGT